VGKLATVWEAVPTYTDSGPKPTLHTVLRLSTYLSIAACLLLFVGCDMFGSSSERVPEAEYSGEVTTVQTNGEGEAKIEANLNSQGDEYDLTIDVKTTDEDGNSLSDVQVQYGQFNGKSFMMVGSPQGNYLPQVFFGTPEEMIKYFSGSIETNSKSSATKKESAAAVTVAATATIGMIALTKASIDIIKGAYKTEKFYITDQVERGEDYIAYCKTFSEVAELIDARVGTSLAGTSIAVNFLTLGAGGVSGGALEGSSLALDVGMLGVEGMRDALLERAVESWGEEADAINDERPVEVRVYFSEGDGAGTKIENFYARFDIIRKSSRCEGGGKGPTYSPGNGYEYFVTGNEYDPDTDDISSSIEQEFGSNAELADWNTLKDLYSDDKSGLVSFLDGVGMAEDDNAYLQRGGEQYWSEDRHYFVKRHNGDPGDNFLVHDDLHSNTLSLGSWYNSNPALVRLPE